MGVLGIADVLAQYFCSKNVGSSAMSQEVCETVGKASIDYALCGLWKSPEKLVMRCVISNISL